MWESPTRAPAPIRTRERPLTRQNDGPKAGGIPPITVFNVLQRTGFGRKPNAIRVAANVASYQYANGDRRNACTASPAVSPSAYSDALGVKRERVSETITDMIERGVLVMATRPTSGQRRAVRAMLHLGEQCMSAGTLTLDENGDCSLCPSSLRSAREKYPLGVPGWVNLVETRGDAADDDLSPHGDTSASDLSPHGDTSHVSPHGDTPVPTRGHLSRVPTRGHVNEERIKRSTEGRSPRFFEERAATPSDEKEETPQTPRRGRDSDGTVRRREQPDMTGLARQAETIEEPDYSGLTDAELEEQIAAAEIDVRKIDAVDQSTVPPGDQFAEHVSRKAKARYRRRLLLEERRRRQPPKSDAEREAEVRDALEVGRRVGFGGDR